MAGKSGLLGPTFLDQSLVVDFARNSLPKYHAGFESLSKYHAQQSQVCDAGSQPVKPSPLSPADQLTARAGTSVAAVAAVATIAGDGQPNVRRTAVGAMKFWKTIFAAAMTSFQTLPGVKNPERDQRYDIRKAENWDTVYEKLVAARDHYTKETGVGGHLHKTWRWIADNVIEVVRVAVAVSPQPTIATPVFAAVGIIIEAVKIGAERRNEVLQGLEGLEDIFSDVELFLATFEGEQDIESKAVVLVAHVLVAVERGIGFFTRRSLVRGIQVISQGKKYEEPLRQSLQDITKDGKSLMAQAVKFHIRNFQQFSLQTQNIQALILNGQEDLAVQALHIRDELTDLKGVLRCALDLLVDKHQKERAEWKSKMDVLEAERVAKEIETRRERDARLALESRNVELEFENMIIRSVSPAFQQSAWAPPPCPLSIDRKTLWEQLNIDDIDTADMDHIESRGPFLNTTDCSQTEQIVMHHTFQNWVVSASSAKLLVHGNFHHIPMHTSALSLFCSTLVKAFRARENFLCLVWFCGLHQGGGELSDLNNDDSSEDNMSEWGADSDSDFCSDGDDDNEDLGYPAQYGPGTRIKTITRMMRSLIAQLLCDYQFDDGIDLLPPGLAPEQINGASLGQLRALFAWLVRLLPADITLFCVIDGISFYEREEYEDPLLDMLGDILGLAAEKDLNAALKVLVTSPWPTTVVRIGFEEEGEEGDGETRDFILPLETISGEHFSYKLERLKRELGGDTEGGDEKEGARDRY